MTTPGSSCHIMPLYGKVALSIKMNDGTAITGTRCNSLCLSWGSGLSMYFYTLGTTVDHRGWLVDSSSMHACIRHSAFGMHPKKR